MARQEIKGMVNAPDGTRVIWGPVESPDTPVERGKLRFWDRIPGVRGIVDAGRRLGTAVFDGIDTINEAFQNAEQGNTHLRRR